jgi:hypothetical protein
MLRYSAWARSVYLRLTHGGKTHKKQAIVALARKILVRCWAMLRDRRPWLGPRHWPCRRRHPERSSRAASSHYAGMRGRATDSGE